MAGELGQNLRWIARFYRPFRGRLIATGLQSVVVAAVATAIPLTYIGIVDTIREGLSGAVLRNVVLLLLGLTLLRFAVSVTNAARRARINIELEWEMRQQLFDRLIRMDQAFYDRQRLGDLVTRLTDDVGRKLAWFACSGIFRGFESLLRVLFSVGAMIWIDPLLALVALVPVPFQIGLYVRSAGLLDTRFRALQAAISRVSEAVETSFGGIRVVQAYCREQQQSAEFERVANERAEAEVAAERVHIFLHSLFGHFGQLAQVVALVAGGIMVIDGRLTVGEFVAFDYYVLFMVWPVFDLGRLLAAYRRAAISIGRLRELDGIAPAIRSPERSREPSEPSERAGRLAFEQVDLVRGERQVLHQVDLAVNHERMIAAVGGVGAGKSSLMDLVPRLFDPSAGQIRLDGVPLEQQRLGGLRRRIGYVSQDPLLFTETVAANIRFGRDEIDDDTVRWAAELAQLGPELESFRDGLDTPIGLRGMTVSGGQKQRISIARALAGRPEILVLDDATSHLDAETEAALWDALRQVLPQMRLLVASHRTATLERAERIVVLREGRVVEQGTHAQLLDAGGEYHRLYAQAAFAELLG